MRQLIAAVALVLIVGFVVSAAQHGQQPPSDPMSMDGAKLHKPNDIKWVPGPPSLPRGSTMAVLEGDPSREGPFVFRAKLPDGYRIPPHTHPKVERITVISGTFMLGMGAQFDESAAMELPAGSYGYWPAGMEHFAWAKGETIVQVHGTGPWTINYLNPEDDPRNQARESPTGM